MNMAQSIRRVVNILFAALFVSAGLAATGSTLAYALTFIFSRFGTAKFGSSVFGGAPMVGETPAVPVPFAQTWALSVVVAVLIITVYILKYHRKESSS